MMDCTLSRLLLQFRPAEIAGDDRTALALHLADCAGCTALADTSANTDAALRRAMNDVPLSAGLQSRLAKLVDLSRAKLLRRKLATASLAASALIGVLLVPAVVSQVRKPYLDTQAVAAEFDRQRDFAGNDLAEWLAAQGLPVALPQGLDEQLAVFHGTGRLQGRDVCTVILQRGRDTAHVYILPKAAFKLDDARLATTASSWGRVDVHRQDGFVYVLITTAADLQPFVKANPLS